MNRVDANNRTFLLLPIPFAVCLVVIILAAQFSDSAPPVAAAPDDISGCIDFGSDTDNDGISRCIELEFGSAPDNAASTPEHLAYDHEYYAHTCADGVDNDLDSRADHRDFSCRVPNECLGPLRSALVRSGVTFSARDPVTEEFIQFGHFGKSFNPGDYHGTAGWDEFMSLRSWWYRGCGLPIPDLIGCIDFDNSSTCPPGDDDNDGFSNYTELVTGSDPSSAASTPEDGLLDELFGSSTCKDGMDNDGDGKRDKGDEGCRRTCSDFGARDRCSDEDHDGWLKYIEVWFGSDPSDPTSTPENPGDCVDFDDIDCVP